MAALIPEKPGLKLIRKFPDGKWRVIYHQSGNEWLHLDNPYPEQIAYWGAEKQCAQILSFRNPCKILILQSFQFIIHLYGFFFRQICIQNQLSDTYARKSSRL
jgi:hypothetical protein